MDRLTFTAHIFDAIISLTRPAVAVFLIILLRPHFSGLAGRMESLNRATVCVFSAAMAVALLLTLPFATAHACVAVAGMPCPVSGFRVFFHPNSAEITTQSREVLVPTVARIQKQQPTTLRIIGYTDRSAEEESNQSLAERRACAVASALIGLGIQGDRLEISAMPGIYRIPTRRGAAEPQNRHVEVILGEATDRRDTGATACGLPGVRSAPTASLAAQSSEFQNTSRFAAFEIARRLFDTDRAAALDWFLVGKIAALYDWMQCGNSAENFQPFLDVNALIVAEYIHDHVEERLDAFRRVQTRPNLFSNATPPCGNNETDLQTIQNIIRRALRNPFAFYVKFIERKLPD